MKTRLLVPLLLKPKTVAGSFPSLAYYWDNRFADQVYQDTSETTLAASGETVASWLDRVGGQNLEQSTAANEPTNRLGEGLEFDGTNDFLTCTIADIPANGLTVYWRANPTAFAATQVMLDWGNMTLSAAITTGLMNAAHSGVGNIGASTTALTAATLNTVGFRYNKTTGAFRWCVNAGTPNTGTQARAVSGTSLHVGGEQGTSFRFTGKIPQILIYTTAHTDAEMDNAMAWLRGLPTA